MELDQNWIKVSGEWKDGDIISLSLPMELYVEKLDTANTFPLAIMYGPTAMATNVTDQYPVDYVGNEEVNSYFMKAQDDLPSFRSKKYPELLLRPYYHYKQEEPYMLYFDPEVRNRLLEKNFVFNGHWERRGYFFSNEDNAGITTEFEGSGVRLYFFRTENSGIVKVKIDGREAALIDLYSNSRGSFSYELKGFKNRRHTLELRVLNKKNEPSRNTYVNLMAVDKTE